MTRFIVKSREELTADEPYLDSWVTMQHASDAVERWNAKGQPGFIDTRHRYKKSGGTAPWCAIDTSDEWHAKAPKNLNTHLRLAAVAAPFLPPPASQPYFIVKAAREMCEDEPLTGSFSEIFGPNSYDRATAYAVKLRKGAVVPIFGRWRQDNIADFAVVDRHDAWHLEKDRIEAAQPKKESPMSHIDIAINDRVCLSAIGFSQYSQQAKGSAGRVMAKSSPGWWEVQWDNGCINLYEPNDLEVLTTPRFAVKRADELLPDEPYQDSWGYRRYAEDTLKEWNAAGAKTRKTTFKVRHEDTAAWCIIDTQDAWHLKKELIVEETAAIPSGPTDAVICLAWETLLQSNESTGCLQRAKEVEGVHVGNTYVRRELVLKARSRELKRLAAISAERDRRVVLGPIDDPDYA